MWGKKEAKKKNTDGEKEDRVRVKELHWEGRAREKMKENRNSEGRKSEMNRKKESARKRERKEESNMNKATEITGPKTDFQAKINTLWSIQQNYQSSFPTPTIFLAMG